MLSLGLSVFKFFATLLAVSWFGMWMGVTSRRANVAVLKTMVFIYVLPVMTLWFVQIMLMVTMSLLAGGMGGSAMPYWVPQLVIGLLGLAIDVFFFVLARRKLLGNFRAVVAKASGVAVRAASLPVSAPPPLPVASP